jgi:tungstate transport system ATP-binding protein
MLFSLRNLRKTYGERTVLNLPELSLTGDGITALLGPNGSGKTTLLSILAFLERPSGGELFYRDRPVRFSSRAIQALRREVVLVDQHPILFSTSVFRNVEYGLKIRRIPRAERRKTVEAALERVDMLPLAGAPGPGLSGGETQRAAIARALACHPRVILFDEPTASVDMASQIAIERIIRDLHEESGIAVILATHNLFQAAKLADERIFLFDGRLGTGMYENFFSGVAESGPNGPAVRLDKAVALPLSEPAEGAIRVAVNPKSVRVSANAPEAAPEEVLPGRLLQITAEGEWVRLLVDVGVPLNSLMKASEFRAAGFQIGASVYARCPAFGVRLI